MYRYKYVDIDVLKYIERYLIEWKSKFSVPFFKTNDAFLVL